LKNPTILLVEDEFLVMNYLRSLLGVGRVDIVGTAATSTEAIALVKALDPDIVLLDIALEKVDSGLEVARFCKEHSRARIIFISGYLGGSLKERALAFEPIAYLVKPILAGELLTAIDSLGPWPDPST